MISRTAYSVISVTTPAPTVRPPSRIANRNSFSIATGVIRSIVIVTLSPGITISTPPRNLPPPPPSALRRSKFRPHPTPTRHMPPSPPPHTPPPPPPDAKDFLERHQKCLVHRPLRRRDVAFHRLHQLPYALRRLTVPRLLHRPQRRPPDHRNLVPRKLVLLQQLPHLQLHQVQNLRVVHHVHLVHEHHQKRHVHLPRQPPVLPRLRHRPVVRRHHHNRPVLLRRPRDHVLDVVGVPRTVDVRVVPLRRLVLHVRDANRDPPLPLLLPVVDRPKLPHRHPAELRVQHPRDRRPQRRLTVIDVPDRPNVHVRLRPLVLRLRHGSGLRLRVLAGAGARRRLPPDFRHDLFGDRRRNLFVPGELHRGRRPPLRHRAEVRHVPEHLSQRDVGADHLRAAARLHREDAAAAAVQVAHHGPHVLLGRHDLDVHHGFEEDRLGLAARLLERHRRRDLEGHLRRVHVVVGTVHEPHLHVDHRVARQDARLERLAHTLLDGGDELLGDRGRFLPR